MADDDMALVREYALTQSEQAFATIVSRHLNLVYSVGLRQTSDPHLAQEITQTVFIILARKAKTLRSRTILPGWLCRTTRYASANVLTVQRRRQQREQEAYMETLGKEPESEAWTQIIPLLDKALARLGEDEHNAVVLRYFEGKSFSEVAAAMGSSADAAKKRVRRAVEKLRKIFMKSGVALSAAAIAEAVSANSLQAAPPALANSVLAAVAAQGAAAGGSTLIIVKGALKIMAWTKAKTAVVAGAVVLLAAGTTTVTVLRRPKPEPEASAWQDERFFTNFDHMPPMVKIVHSKSPGKNRWIYTTE